MMDRKHRQMGPQVERNPWNEIQSFVPVHPKMDVALKSPAPCRKYWFSSKHVRPDLYVILQRLELINLR